MVPVSILGFEVLRILTLILIDGELGRINLI